MQCHFNIILLSMTKLGVKNSRQQVTQATTEYSICKFKLWNFQHVIILAFSVLWWLLEFSKTFTPLKVETDLMYSFILTKISYEFIYSQRTN